MRRALGGLFLITALILTGCSTTAEKPSTLPKASAGSATTEAASPSASPSPSPSAIPSGTYPSGDDNAQILGQYKRFWTVIFPKLDKVPAKELNGFLREVTADPYTSFLEKLRAKHRSDGVELYGAAEVLHQTVTRKGAKATVRGCTDQSHFGRADLNGKKLGRGFSENGVTLYLKRISGRWLIVNNTYQKKAGC